MGYHRALWIEINENMLLCFRQHDIIPPIALNLRLRVPSTLNKFNDTLHTIFVKYDIYHNIHYIYNRAIYPLPLHLARVFKILYELLTRLIHAADKSAEENNRLCEMVTRIKEND